MADESTRSEDIIINDNYQTKKLTLFNLANSVKGYAVNKSVVGKETLTFIVDDPNYIEIIPLDKIRLAMYDYFLEKDPLIKSSPPEGYTYAYASYPWLRYSRAGLKPWVNYGDADPEKPGLQNSLQVSDDNGGAICYFYRNLTNAEKALIKQSGSGDCWFTVGVSDKTVGRNSPYIFTDINGRSNNNIKNNYFKQHNYVSFCSYDPFGTSPNQDDNLRRFNIIFRVDLTDEEHPVMNVYSNMTNSESEPVKVARIEDWDGQSLRSFRCSFAPAANNELLANLFILDPETNLWNLLIDNIPQSHADQTYWGSVQFGCFSTPGYSTLCMQQLIYDIILINAYQIKYNGVLFETSDLFKEHCQNELYKYNIGGTGDILIDWWFNNKQNTYPIDDSTTFTFTGDWFDNRNIENYMYFADKQKKISVYAEEGAIKSFRNPGKNISSINVRELTNLEELDLSNNKLTEIDLSENLKLYNINLSNNPNLSKLILPMGDFCQVPDDHIHVLNLQHTALTNIEIINNRAVNPKLTLTIDDISGLKSFMLRGVDLTNPDYFTTVQFPDIEVMDISETNLLTSKDRLRQILNNLPNRQGKDPGIIYLYGRKYTHNGVQGTAKGIAQELELLKIKNWLFYL